MSDSEESTIPLSKRQRFSLSAVMDRSEDEMDDQSSTTSTREEESSRSDTPTLPSRRGYKWSKQPKKCKLQFKCSNLLKESHGQPLFGVQVNLNCADTDPVVFATVGHNRVTVYECQDGGKVKLLQSYSDPSEQDFGFPKFSFTRTGHMIAIYFDKDFYIGEVTEVNSSDKGVMDENFYCCAWSFDPITKQPILAAAGMRGVIRILSLSAMHCIQHFVGHGNAVNELKFHPRDCRLLLSVSKDHTLRIWNVHTSVCVLILGGVDGHRDEVLSADFNLSGTKIVSCGMDHSLKMWRLDTKEIVQVVKESNQYTAKSNTPFPTFVNHFPDFSTRDIHRNYVDCTRWLGNLVLSKSCENCIICWKPGPLDGSDHTTSVTGGTKTDDTVSILHRFDYRECEIWYMRFCLDYQHKILALGNQVGCIFLWDLDVEDPSQTKFTKLTHQRCNTAIRQTAISKDGNILIAVSDDAMIWRWDRVK